MSLVGFRVILGDDRVNLLDQPVYLNSRREAYADCGHKNVGSLFGNVRLVRTVLCRLDQFPYFFLKILDAIVQLRFDAKPFVKFARGLRQIAQRVASISCQGYLLAK